MKFSYTIQHFSAIMFFLLLFNDKGGYESLLSSEAHKVSFVLPKYDINIIYNKTINWIRVELWILQVTFLFSSFPAFGLSVVSFSRRKRRIFNIHININAALRSHISQMLYYADGLCWVMLQKEKHETYI